MKTCSPRLFSHLVAQLTCLSLDFDRRHERSVHVRITKIETDERRIDSVAEWFDAWERERAKEAESSEEDGTKTISFLIKPFKAN